MKQKFYFIYYITSSPVCMCVFLFSFWSNSLENVHWANGETHSYRKFNSKSLKRKKIKRKRKNHRNGYVCKVKKTHKAEYFLVLKKKFGGFFLSFLMPGR